MEAVSRQGVAMSIIGWILLGLIAGFVASKIVNKVGEGVVLDIALGIVGAIVGGFLFALLGAQGVTGFNLYSMFVAVIGAIIVLVIYHAVVGRRSI
jgi:uncharacterized membrane protein YeaQ/YmgE (transglycosylase-associated protein family)